LLSGTGYCKRNSLEFLCGSCTKKFKEEKKKAEAEAAKQAEAERRSQRAAAVAAQTKAKADKAQQEIDTLAAELANLEDDDEADEGESAAGGGSIFSSAAANEANGWTCSVCTFADNSLASDACAICEAARAS
jgi:hypothetical protein